MERLIPLILLAAAVFLWLRARKKTAAYLAAYESASHPAPDRAPDAGDRPEPPAPSR
ncbi:hypothetical protein [Streptomyces nitrosporeus]|uniref:hypothetical protein n=1 Tax=Streptomyces nitrosporeus TaxID=28894 RepID=UPI00142EF9BE|nr:hypothetical protein [Streptomyces nitrosporeus]GGY76387.1 hypothetical protein GCM10010327_02920 [Streptomyces nitrosporeus]